MREVRPGARFRAINIQYLEVHSGSSDKGLGGVLRSWVAPVQIVTPAGTEERVRIELPLFLPLVFHVQRSVFTVFSFSFDVGPGVPRQSKPR